MMNIIDNVDQRFVICEDCEVRILKVVVQLFGTKGNSKTLF